MIVNRFIFLYLTLLLPLSLNAAKCKLVIGGQCRQCQDTTVSPKSPNCVRFPIPSPLPIAGCRTYKNALAAPPVCINCPPGLALKAKDCEALPNCLDAIANPKPSLCLKCAEGLMPTGDLLRCLPIIPNCQEYLKSSVFSNSCHLCVKCKGKFLLAPDNMSCIMPTEIENCLKYPANKKSCDACKPDCVLSSNKLKCLPKIQNCLTHDSSENKSGILLCSQCIEGMTYTTDRRKCLPSIPDCEVYCQASSSSNNFHYCMKCKAKFQLSKDGKRCQKLINIENCQNYLSDYSGCEVCRPNFILTTNKQKCLPAIINCISYNASPNGDNQLLCIKCAEGTVLVDDSTQCFPEIPNCQEYAHLTLQSSCHLTCVKCQANYQLSPDGLLCQKILAIENCQKYLADYSGCEQCLPNFVLSANRQKCLAQIQNCQVYDINLNANGQLQCKQCAEGMTYTTDRRKCLPSISNCQQYSSSSTYNDNDLICVKCQANFQLSLNGQSCQRILVIENCQRILPDNTGCEVCLPNFVLTNSKLKCLPQIINCISYESSLNVNGQLRCDQCATGFTTTNDRRKCLPSISNCEQYSPSTTESSSRLVCIKCSANFVLLQNGAICQQILSIENCQNILADNSGCEMCLPGYVLTANRLKCLPEIANCTTYNSSLNVNGQLQCVKCTQGYTTTGDMRRCLPIIPNCAQYSQSTTESSSQLVCINCSANFVLIQNGSICQQILLIENCQRILADNTGCEICLSGFVLAANKLRCLPEITNCISYNSSLNANGQLQCDQCIQGFITTVDKRKCLPSIVNCVQYSQSTSASDNLLICIKCSDNFVLLQNGTLCQEILSIENCQSILPNNSGCEVCLPSFVLASKRLKCLPEIQNCISYNAILNQYGQLECNQCAQGLTITSDKRKCLPTIPNCEQYTSTSTISDNRLVCAKCQTNFQLTQNGFACERILVIENCKRILADNSGCEVCLPNFVLTTNRLQCLNEITNCISYYSSLNANGQLQCSQCAAGLTTTGDRRRCLPTIPNCEQYSPSTTILDDSLICISCAANFVLLENGLECQQLISVENCQSILGDNTGCEICLPGFVIAANKLNCLPEIQNCISYNPLLNANGQLQCDQCAQGKTTTSDKRKCLPSITNCELYSNTTTESDNRLVCIKCSANFVLLQNGTICEQIISIENCQSILANNTGCEICLFGFVLAANRLKCLPEIQNCITYNMSLNANGQLKCDQCATGYTATNNRKKCLPSISNCELYSQSTTESSSQLVCIKCSANFVLLQNGTICQQILSIEHCQNILADNTGCEICRRGFVLAANRLKCLPEIQNCITYNLSLKANEQLTCDQCATGFITTNDRRKCLPSIANCEQYSPSTTESSSRLVCIKCSANFVLLQNGAICQQILSIENCQNILADNSGCEMCLPGYVLTANRLKCLPEIANCTTYNSSLNVNGQLQCVKCTQGYSATGDMRRCLPIIPNCAQYSQSTTESSSQLVCIKCSANFVLLQNGSICQQILSIENCQRILADNTGCEICLSGFVLAANKLRCLPQIENCATYDTSLNGNGQLQCTQCTDRFILTSDRRKCLLSIPNCEQYSQSSTASDNSLICVKCSSNYQVSKNGVSCERILVIENCQKILADNTGCEICLPGFILRANNQKCLPQILNCLSYELSLSSSGQLLCRECAEHFLQNASKTMCIFAVANCATQIDSPTNLEMKICTTCISGYKLTDDRYKCLPIISNCATYTPANMFDDAFTCVQCNPGFAVTTDESQCLSAIPNCNSYLESNQNTDTLRCQECAEEFILNSSGSACLQAIPNCSDYNFGNENETALTCIKCKEGYILLQGGRKCVLAIANCLEVILSASGTPICSKCSTGFVTNSSQTQCFLAITNCKMYRPSNVGDTELFCKICETGFQETNNGRLCLKEIANCTAYQPFVLGDTNLKCNICAFGYRKSENQTDCLVSIPNCKIYRQGSNKTSLCSICETGFILSSDFRKCLAEISGCLNYQQSDQNTVYLICTICISDFELSSNKRSCIKKPEPPSIDNCKIYNKSFCVICNEGYSVSDNGKSCVVAIENCFQYRTLNGRVVCAICEDGWVPSTLDQLKCLPKIDNCCMYIESDRNTALNRCETCSPGFVAYCNGAHCQRKIKTCSQSTAIPVEGPYSLLPSNLAGKTIMLKRCDDKTYLNSFFDKSASEPFSLSYGASTYSQNSMWIISESKQGCSGEQITYSINSYANSQTSSLVYTSTSLLGSNKGFGLSNATNTDGQKWAFKQAGPNTYMIKNMQSGFYLDDFNLSVNCPTLFEIIVVKTNK